jgi:CRISPR/Cas system-associated exonuclease Cas4 (RecB family)
MTIEELARTINIEEEVERHLLAKNDVHQERDTDGFFHPSQMGGCTRKLWYAACMFPTQHRVGAKLRNTFNHGHVIHDWQQAELGEVLEHLTETNIARDGETGIRFESEFEVSLSDPAHGNGTAQELNIAGRADGLIIVQQDTGEYTRAVYELKSMADASWQKLTRPQTKHIAQATIYSKCFDATAILFQYYNKNGDVSKWFYVEPDEGAWESARAQIGKVRDALSSGGDVPAEYSMWECKSCSYYYDCKPEMR